MTVAQLTALPVAADFAPPPDRATRERWREADRAARPARLARLLNEALER